MFLPVSQNTVIIIIITIIIIIIILFGLIFTDKKLNSRHCVKS